jgi:hypothetical protein
LIITISKNPNQGQTPGIISLGHRSLEKSKPLSLRHLGTSLFTYSIPADLLTVVGLPSPLVEDVEAVELVYKATPETPEVK